MKKFAWRACAVNLLMSAAVCLLMASSELRAGQPANDADRLKAWTAEIRTHIGENFDHLEGLYKRIHTHPELSLQEANTAARLAHEIKEIGFEVTSKVGGHGLVAVLRNGKGPT